MVTICFLQCSQMGTCKFQWSWKLAGRYTSFHIKMAYENLFMVYSNCMTVYEGKKVLGIVNDLFWSNEFAISSPQYESKSVVF
jgi:hypothetical protein